MWQLCIGKDRLILAKYRLNFTRVENWVNQYINQYKQYKPMLTNIKQHFYSLNIYRLISVNISKGTFAIMKNLNRY